MSKSDKSFPTSFTKFSKPSVSGRLSSTKCARSVATEPNGLTMSLTTPTRVSAVPAPNVPPSLMYLPRPRARASSISRPLPTSSTTLVKPAVKSLYPIPFPSITSAVKPTPSKPFLTNSPPKVPRIAALGSPTATAFIKPFDALYERPNKPVPSLASSAAFPVISATCAKLLPDSNATLPATSPALAASATVAGAFSAPDNSSPERATVA